MEHECTRCLQAFVTGKRPRVVFERPFHRKVRPSIVGWALMDLLPLRLRLLHVRPRRAHAQPRAEVRVVSGNAIMTCVLVCICSSSWQLVHRLIQSVPACPPRCMRVMHCILASPNQAAAL